MNLFPFLMIGIFIPRIYMRTASDGTERIMFTTRMVKAFFCADGVTWTLIFVNENLQVWKYGYSSFEHDITEALNDGLNEILLRLYTKALTADGIQEPVSIEMYGLRQEKPII